MRAWYRAWQLLTQVVFCSLFQVRTIGRENVPLNGPLLLVSNHQSFLDPPLCGVGLHRELDYIARDSLFRNPAFAWFIRSLNAFPLKRAHADIGAIKTIIERLRQGRALVLFPEGTRTPTGRLKPIESGIELIARRSRAVIVPVIIDGAFETWPRHQPLPSPGRIFIWYGQAITPQTIKKLPKGALVDTLNHQLQDMQTSLRCRYRKPPL